MSNGGELITSLPINMRVLLWWACGLYWLFALLAVVLRRRSPMFRGAVQYGGRQQSSAEAEGSKSVGSAISKVPSDGITTPPPEERSNEDMGGRGEYLTPLTSAHFARRRRSSGVGVDGCTDTTTDANISDVVTTRLSSSLPHDDEDTSKEDEERGDDAVAKSTFPSSPTAMTTTSSPTPLTPSSLTTKTSSPSSTAPEEDKENTDPSIPTHSYTTDNNNHTRSHRGWWLARSSSSIKVSRKRAFISFYVVGCFVSCLLIGVLMFGVGYGWDVELPYIAGVTDYSVFQCPCFAVLKATPNSDGSVGAGVGGGSGSRAPSSPIITNGILASNKESGGGGGLRCGGKMRSRTTLSGLLLPTAITMAAYDRHMDLALFHQSPPGGGMATIMPSAPHGGGGGSGSHRPGGRVLIQYGGEEVHVTDKHTTDRQYIISQLLLDLRLQVLPEDDTDKPKVVLNKSIACCPPVHPKMGDRGKGRGGVGGGAGAKKRSGSPFSSTTDDAPQRECLCRPTSSSSEDMNNINKKCWMTTPGVVPPPSWFVLLTAITPLGLFILHCLVRLYECNYIFVFRDSSNTIDLNVGVVTPSSSSESNAASSSSNASAVVAAVSPDVVTLFAAVSGSTFYVVAPISLAVTSLEILIKFVEVGLSALMRSGEVSAVSGFGVPKGGGASSSTSPLPINSPAGASLLDTAVFGGGVLLVGFVVLLIFTLIFVFLQGLQVFHHVTLARLQRNRLSERRLRIDEYRKDLLSSHRLLSRNNSRRSLLRTSTTTTDSISTEKRRVSVATGLPPDLEPPYMYPSKEGLFKHILEPHYSLEVCMYVCIAVLTITLCLYAECLAQLLQTKQASSSIDVGTLRLDASYHTTPIPVGGDFALWGIPNSLQLLQPPTGGVSDDEDTISSSFITSIMKTLIGGSIRGTIGGGTISGFVDGMCDTLVPPLPSSSSLLRYVLFFCRIWGALVPTVLVALFTLFNLNTTAQEHREFWVLVAGVVEIPRYNLIPWVL